MPIESYQNANSNISPPQARNEFYNEKTQNIDRNPSKKDYYYPNQKQQKGYYRTKYQTSPDFYQSADYYPSSPPKTYKNRLSDPGVIQTNNAACLGPSAGTATSGPSCNETGLQPRQPQGPLLLRGNASLSVGPVPHATSSGVYYPKYIFLFMYIKVNGKRNHLFSLFNDHFHLDPFSNVSYFINRKTSLMPLRFDFFRFFWNFITRLSILRDYKKK